MLLLGLVFQVHGVVTTPTTSTMSSSFTSEPATQADKQPTPSVPNSRRIIVRWDNITPSRTEAASVHRASSSKRMRSNIRSSASTISSQVSIMTFLSIAFALCNWNSYHYLTNCMRCAVCSSQQLWVSNPLNHLYARNDFCILEKSWLLIVNEKQLW